jgi:MFS family permease
MADRRLEDTDFAAAPGMAKAWGMVGLLWAIGALNYLDRIMLTTMRSSVMDSIPMTDAEFGLLTSSFLWVYGVLSPAGGYLADRFSRSRVIIASLVIWSAITWLTGHATSYRELLTLRILMGVSEACYLPAALALIADYHRGPTRSLATAVNMTGIFVGAGFGGIGGYIAERYHWTQAFTWFGAAGVAYAVVVAIFLRDPKEVGQESADADVPAFGATARALFRSRGFGLILVYWGLLGLAGWTVVGWMPTYLQAQFKLSQGLAGISATGILQSASLGGVLLGGWWADRWSRRNGAARLYVPLIGLLIAAPGMACVAVTDAMPMAIAGLVAYGLAKAFADANMMPILCLVAEPRQRATGYGVLNFFSCVVGGLTIYLGGILRDAHIELNAVFLLSALALFSCALLLWLVRARIAALAVVPRIET